MLSIMITGTYDRTGVVRFSMFDITHIYKDVSKLCLHVFVLRFFALLMAVSQLFSYFLIP